jgi:hypothetical protein
VKFHFAEARGIAVTITRPGIVRQWPCWTRLRARRRRYSPRLGATGFCGA